MNSRNMDFFLLLSLLFLAALQSPSQLSGLELTENGDFSHYLDIGWREYISAVNYRIEHAVHFDPDPDHEVFVYLGTGGGFVEIYQTIFIPSVDIDFGVKTKLYAEDNSPIAWAGAAVIITYLNENGAPLGKTYLASLSSQCPWRNTSTTHVIEVTDSLWHFYSFNISEELLNLPGIDSQEIRKITLSMFNQTEHC